jgi:hypothetical protein
MADKIDELIAENAELKSLIESYENRSFVSTTTLGNDYSVDDSMDSHIEDTRHVSEVPITATKEEAHIAPNLGELLSVSRRNYRSADEVPHDLVMEIRKAALEYYRK